MKNDIRDAATVFYNHARIASLRAQWGDGWDSAHDLFVNGNDENVENVTQAEFEARFKFKNVNDDAFPVLVYLNGNEMLAWYDEENEYGYIA
jgi:hypothetical protein